MHRNPEIPNHDGRRADPEQVFFGSGLDAITGPLLSATSTRRRGDGRTKRLLPRLYHAFAYGCLAAIFGCIPLALVFGPAFELWWPHALLFSGVGLFTFLSAQTRYHCSLVGEEGVVVHRLEGDQLTTTGVRFSEADRVETETTELHHPYGPYVNSTLTVRWCRGAEVICTLRAEFNKHQFTQPTASFVHLINQALAAWDEHERWLGLQRRERGYAARSWT